MNKRDNGRGDPKKKALKKARLMLVDDHPLVSRGLVALLRTTPDLEVCAEARSAEETLQALAKDVPDLLVLDISLPGTSGIELLKDIHVRYPNLRVIVFSVHEEHVYAERALRAGAKGYIMKQAPGNEIIGAIRRVLADDMYVSPAVAARMLKLFVSDEHQSPLRTGLETFGDRELQVFTHLGHGRSTKEIAGLLSLSPKTIQTYRESIKRKLGLKNATELVHGAAQWVQTQK